MPQTPERWFLVEDDGIWVGRELAKVLLGGIGNSTLKRLLAAAGNGTGSIRQVTAEQDAEKLLRFAAGHRGQRPKFLVHVGSIVEYLASEGRPDEDGDGTFEAEVDRLQAELKSARSEEARLRGVVLAQAETIRREAESVAQQSVDLADYVGGA